MAKGFIEPVTAGWGYPAYVNADRRALLAKEDAVLGLFLTSLESGRRLAYFPGLPEATAPWLEQVAGCEVLLVDARPVVVPGCRVQRAAVDDQRPDAVRGVATDLAEILPVPLAVEPVDVAAVGLFGRVRRCRVQRTVEDGEGVADVVRCRRRPSPVEPARLGSGVDAERDAQLVGRPVVAAGARDRAQIEAGPRRRVP